MSPSNFSLFLSFSLSLYHSSSPSPPWRPKTPTQFIKKKKKNPIDPPSTQFIKSPLIHHQQHTLIHLTHQANPPNSAPCIWSSQSEFKAKNQAKKKTNTINTKQYKPEDHQRTTLPNPRQTVVPSGTEAA